MTIVYFVLVLSITIFIHELGHFIFAKRAGIHVYEFCIGMGPSIFKFNRKNDETVYGVRLFPIGGFCSMAGETVEEDADIPVHKRMQSKSWSEKFLTIIAGVMFNFIFAIFIFFIVGLINGNPNTKPIISYVSEEGPAYIAGLRSGDVIESVNGIETKNISRLMIEYTVNYGEDLDITLKDGRKIKIIPTEEEEKYSYGFSLDESVKTGLFEAIKYAFTKFVSLINELFIIVGYLCIGKLNLSALSGPIGIYNVVDMSAKAGLINVIYLIGYLSTNVGFINLFPLPAFDGGRILFLLIEKVRRKPIKQKVENIIHNVGFALLMVLTVLITYNDIMRFIIS